MDDINIKLSIKPDTFYVEERGFPPDERISGEVNLMEIYTALVQHILSLEYRIRALEAREEK